MDESFVVIYGADFFRGFFCEGRLCWICVQNLKHCSGSGLAFIQGLYRSIQFTVSIDSYRLLRRIW